jgi:hypothetical protein
LYWIAPKRGRTGQFRVFRAVAAWTETEKLPDPLLDPWFALLAIEQALIEFLAEGRGQAGDFAVACHTFLLVGMFTWKYYHT